jgi:hypothetical protein
MNQRVSAALRQMTNDRASDKDAEAVDKAVGKVGFLSRKDSLRNPKKKTPEASSQVHCSTSSNSRSQGSAWKGLTCWVAPSAW